MENPKYSSDRLTDLSNIQKNFQIIGPLIKKAREEQNISLEFLSEVLKINEDYLIAIEEGNKSALPELVYVKAMIRRIFERLDIKPMQTKVINDSLKKTSIVKETIKVPKSARLYLAISFLSLIAIMLGAYSTRFVLKFTSGIDDKHETIYSQSK